MLLNVCLQFGASLQLSFLSLLSLCFMLICLFRLAPFEKFLWTERTWCLFMSSKMNSECSCCTTVHATFTTYKTFTCTFRPCLSWLLWVCGEPCAASVSSGPCVHCCIDDIQNGFSCNERSNPGLCRTQHRGKIHNRKIQLDGRS